MNDLLPSQHVRLLMNVKVPRCRYAPMPISFVGCDYRTCATEDEIMRNHGAYEPLIPTIDQDWSKKFKSLDENHFELEYLVVALLSRGAIVKDQILVCSL